MFSSKCSKKKKEIWFIIIIIIIIIKVCQQHGFPYIVLIMSWSLPLASLLNGIQYLLRANESNFLLVGQFWYVAVHRRITLMSSFIFLLLQCPAYLAHITWTFYEIGSNWLYVFTYPSTWAGYDTRSIFK